jgi:hypothetical protein
MLLPFCLVVGAKVPRKRLLTPGAIDWVRYGRKCADGFVFAGVTEELPISLSAHNILYKVKGLRGEAYESKSPMPTHTMTRNTNPARINLLAKRLEDCRWQFLGYVAVHIVPFVVRRECGVDIEAGAGAEVVCVVFALDV